MYNPTMFDVAIYLGTFGLFFTGFLLFLRFLPMVSIAEAKLVLPESNPHHGPNALLTNAKDSYGFPLYHATKNSIEYA